MKRYFVGIDTNQLFLDNIKGLDKARKYKKHLDFFLASIPDNFTKNFGKERIDLHLMALLIHLYLEIVRNIKV